MVLERSTANEVDLLGTTDPRADSLDDAPMISHLNAESPTFRTWSWPRAACAV